MIDPEGFEATVLTSLARIEQKIVDVPRHAERIDKLEGWVSWAKGLWAGLGIIVLAMAGALAKHLMGDK